MKTGSIILVHNPFQWKFPFSSTVIWPLLRLVTGSYFHHVAIVWQVEGEFLIVEALGKGVTVTSWDIWKNRAKRHIKVIPVSCNEVDFISHLGKSYDKTSFFFFCLIRILFNKWIGTTQARATDQLYCFEFAALVHNMPDAYKILPLEFIKAIEEKVV